MDTNRFGKDFFKDTAFGLLISILALAGVVGLISVVDHFSVMKYRTSYVSFTCTRGGCEVDRTQVLVELDDDRYEFTPENTEAFKKALEGKAELIDSVSNKAVIKFDHPVVKFEARRVVSDALDSLNWVRWSSGIHNYKHGDHLPDEVIIR